MEKRRPALVISKPWMAKDCGPLWVAMIKSAENDGWPSDIAIGNLTTVGLESPSVIRPVKIATIEAESVLKKIGEIGLKEINAVNSVFTMILP